jgi:hypothetical protein
MARSATAGQSHRPQEDGFELFVDANQLSFSARQEEV